jgi:transcriptional regulator
VYLPKHFEQHDRSALIALMRERPLATLIVPGDDGVPNADLIPLEFHPGEGAHGTLRGHVARANPLWRRADAQALAVFTGPEAYVSPGWYASKREHGKVVPTWNYTMVQARGVLRAIDDAPWLRAIVGIEIELTSLVGKWKTSQNRSAADREGVAHGLADAKGEMAALVLAKPHSAA